MKDSGKGRVGVFMRLLRKEDSMYQAIDSVLRQTYENLRLYISVSDRTQEEVARYTKEDSRVVILPGKEKTGLGICLKQLAEENEYVTTIDADDWYAEDYLNKLVCFLQQEKLDIAACGNYFIINGEIGGERRQETMQWELAETSRVFPDMYGFFRTIWGKLIASEVLLRCDFSVLPRAEEYGGYGGDTLHMFTILSYSRRAGILGEALYYYRMSAGTASYQMKEGRLESDEVLYHYMVAFLKKTGTVTEENLRMLMMIYANATLDTLRLIVSCRTEAGQRLREIRYLLEKEPAQEMLGLEHEGALGKKKTAQGWQRHRDCFCSLIFSDPKPYRTKELLPIAWQIFRYLYPESRNVLEEATFSVLLYSAEILGFFVSGNEAVLRRTLWRMKAYLKDGEKADCSRLICRITGDGLLKKQLEKPESHQRPVAAAITLYLEGKTEEALQECGRAFDREQKPADKVEVLELWIDLAAKLELAEEFVLGKELRVDMLAEMGKRDEAKAEYEELRQLGVQDANMELLGGYFTEDEGGRCE